MFIYLYGIPDEYQPSEDELRQEISNLNRVSTHYLHHAAQESVPNAPMLSGVDNRALALMDKRSKDFFSIALKNTQESRNVALLIGHLCYSNYEVSRRFGKIILKGLNSTNEMEVKPFVDCMTVYLSLDDEF